MESKRARLKIIQDWMREDDGDGAEKSDVLPETAGGFYPEYRRVERNATLEELGGQFLNVLKSFNNPAFHGQDWKVEIAVPDRAAVVYIISTANELSLKLHEGPFPAEEERGLDARLSIPFEDLRLLTNFETDYVSVISRNKRIDNPDKPLVRPLCDLLFGAYNLFHLKPVFRHTLVERLYRTGKVSGLSGVERLIYPWAVSADIGNILYGLILENKAAKTLEIGLAYGLSALFMCQAHKDKNDGYHTAVDPCQSVEFQSIGVDQVEKAGLTDYFRLLEARDYDILPALVKENEKFDFIFIDGLHMHDYVVLDYFYSDLLLEVNGLMVFDDCHAPGVSSAVAYLEKNRNYKFLGQYSDYRIRVYRKLSEDARTINNSNHHVDYFRKYYELAGLQDEAHSPVDKPQALPARNDIAIIGIDGILPKDRTIGEFWQSVAGEEILYDQYPAEFLYTRDPASLGGRQVAGGLIGSPFAFDPDFFKISRSEAEQMDPQLRRLLMSVYKSMEDAGYTAQQLAAGRVGVFVGAENSDYNELHRPMALENGYFLNHAGSTIANRLSYHFDFKGPSEVINTMCSSGAFCLYRATELLRKGEIDFAVVGAVKMNFSEATFQSLNNLNITSSRGSCYSFHRNSEGYIRSEGVISMILTTAEKADREKDFVYATIKEIAVNFNGKDGNSMFSPSKNGQKEAIKNCYRRAGVSMADITYIEAQGMGNEISDFVEFNAINEAYAELRKEDSGPAAGDSTAPVISTVKPILGHMECVSALGAILKIILSFRTRTVYRIPRLSPGDINQKLESEKAHCALLTANKAVTTERPMLAGLNSFGASGTNVHILLEEGVRYETADNSGAPHLHAQLLIVSAKSEASLRRYIREIDRFLNENVDAMVLSSLCYTFQLRREHYQHRVCFYIEEAQKKDQVENLKRMLARYPDGETPSAFILDNLENSGYHFKAGRPSGSGETIKNKSLLDDGLSWLAGAEVDWKQHHALHQPAKTGGMPTYPFDLKTCKLQLAAGAGRARYPGAGVHPLLQENTSDLRRQSYSSIFSGEEFFLADHRVNGQKILPAAAYLEMARAAVAQATPDAADGAALELRDVIWMQPVVAVASRRVGIALFASGTEERIDFEIFSTEAPYETAPSEILNCQGWAAFIHEPAPAALDLERLRGQMRHGELEPDGLYCAFGRMGIDYGPSHRGLKTIHQGERQLLARVSLPDAVADTRQDFLLHPGLLDSALQAGIALTDSPEELAGRPALPFALESIRVISTCPKEIYAWIRQSEAGSSGRIIRLDADLCDTEGNICVQIRGLASRVLERNLESFSPRAATGIDDGRPHMPLASGADISSPANASGSLRARGIAYFRQLVAQTLKSEPRQIEPSRHFSEYGLDSLLVVQLTNRLREKFKDIKATLFFEVQTINGLVDYFLENRQEELAAAMPAAPSGGLIPQTEDTARPTRRSRREFRVAAGSAADTAVFDVAIIGLSGRYPGSKNPEQLWKNIVSGTNCISEIPGNRWNWETHYDAEKGKPGKIYSRWGGFIEDIDKFDPLFFKISPLEAERLDPQERLFLETCYHAIEDAGYTAGSLDATRRIGVFVGVTNSMYARAPDHFSFANRISYLFDFQGPSMAVDTACSSSLTAIHLALESIYSGLSGCAVAGGVNLLIDPYHYMRLSETTALSADNRCKSFGDQADGFIDAEGVGAVILKPLDRAERDGDHIYGIIKSSSINAGGKTHGYTVPNPKAQAGLISEALKRAGLRAEHISYVEAHGTGTPLGDPIEIAGLSRAFKETGGQRQSCSIGSLKSNIGHCEAAAGIAGLTKVLLQFKHGQLVPSLHSETTNPEIDFSQTPFKIQQRLETWQRPLLEANGTVREFPRTAGISSFGIGGANAHIIVQEYLPSELVPPVYDVGPDAMVIIPLSARTEGQLRQRARDLLDFISDREQPVDLTSMAYTLQVGRDAMEVRLGFIAGSAEQLVEKLWSYLNGGLNIEGVYQGQVKHNKDMLSLFSDDADLQETLDKWIAHKKFPKLLELWVKGLDLDWTRFYGEVRPRRMSLPVYPFAKERYWARDTDTVPAPAAGRLHPLLHQNTSDLSRQSYRSTFSGEEFFLRDHRVNGQKVLPGVAYLEMARAAVEQAWPVREAPAILELRNTVWAQPFVVTGNKQLTLVLWANEGGQIDYEICSEDAGEEVVHCRGQAVFSRQETPARLDLAQLRGELGQDVVEAAEVYEAFARMGLEYGPGHRGIVSIYKGVDQLLAVLNLPMAAGTNEYGLHPGLMDSALQASLGLIGDWDALAGRPLLPFALTDARILSACGGEMYAWVRYSPGSGPCEKVVKLDIDLCDPQGNLCVQLREFSCRALSGSLERGASGLLLAAPAWEAATTAAAEHIDFAQRHVLLCGLPNVDEAQLQTRISGSRCLQLQSRQGNIAERYSETALACFELIHGLLADKPQGRLLVQLVIGNEPEQRLFAGLSGLLKTAALENPQLSGQIILVEPQIDAEALTSHLEGDGMRPQDVIIQYDQSGRRVLRWRETAPGGEPVRIVFKDRGVYLITGGLGGLGLLFAREILTQTAQAKVILSGRGELTDDRKALLDSLPGAVEYYRLDLGDAEHAERLITGILQEHKQLNGILHSAGMIADNFILKKTSGEFSKVLAPKVAGTFNLDQASRDIDLDFLALFSSGAAVSGNIGQADYAAANGFMDWYAAYRNELAATGQRRGLTLSVNWPLWHEGGMRPDPASGELLQHTLGMQPMQTATGMRAFHRSLELRHSQTLVMEGDLDKMRQAVFAEQARSATTAAAVRPVSQAPVGGKDDGRLLEQTESFLSRQFSELFKLPPHEIDPQAPLEKYGIDSILAMKLTAQLELSFGSLSKTLFFEYQTIRELARYLVKTFPKTVREKTGVRRETPVTAASARVVSGESLIPSSKGKKRFFDSANNARKEVAIIGLAGKYPMADDLEAFWKNLQSGRDCITEIPPERWDHNAYYDPDRNRTGKSYSKWGGFINDFDKFDALFFNISPKEAELIDPQERLFMETVWQTVEDAGYSKESISTGRVGVYVGVMWGQYELFGAAALNEGVMVPGSSYASIANRVSYFFNFHGPSIAVDTMCSSSLTAIHLASEEISRGEIDAAIAGGVNVTIHPNKYLNLSQGSFASSDGRCRSFGAGGDGYVPGEGVGAVLLKPLEKALQDGDHVYAVIKASTINHGGKTNGYTVPNPNAQADLIFAALAKAGIDPATLGYVETHGTGTALGDPIEVTGLTKAFTGVSGENPAKQFCPIGSVKSNIGHLESAAGIAAVTKVLLQMKHGLLAPSLHADTLNPNIRFEDSPFYVQTKLAQWERPAAHPRRAGVSSFGAGGANAHLILEEYPESTETGAVPQPGIPEAFVLSARDRDSLLRYVAKLVNFLESRPDISPGDAAYTSQVGRTLFNERLVILAVGLQELQDKLSRWMNAQKDKHSDLKGYAAEGVFHGNIKDAPPNAGALIDGEAGVAFLQILLEKRDLEKLAGLWIAGYEIDWSLLPRHVKPRRVSLPTYPFARERYWIGVQAQPVTAAQTTAERAGTPVEDEEKHRLYFHPEWQARSLNVSAEDPARPALILNATDELYLIVKNQLGAGPVIRVQTGAGWQETQPDVFILDPEREEHFDRLAETLKSRGRLPRRILHCCIEGAQEDTDTGELNRDLYIILYLCKALMKQKHAASLHILSVFRSASEAAAPQHAALAGFLRTLSLENPNYLARTLEIRSDAGTEVSIADCSELILGEFRDADWSSGEIRYQARAKGVYARHIRELVSCKPAQKTAELPLKQRGVYMITGGLGGLGFIVGEYLVKNYDARLVLLGRSAPGAEQERKLARLNACNTEILYVQADVSRPEDVESAVRQAKARFSTIDGVIHSAGVNRDSFILRKTRKEMEEVLASKVYGALNVDRATQDEKLDLFILFSSVAGVIGNAGQCDYAYGNRFLDAFAEQREYLRKNGQRRGRTLCINWPLWKEGGMTVAENNIALHEQQTGMSPLPASEGILYLEEFLRSGLLQGVALYGIPSRITAHIARTAAAVSAHKRPVSKTIDPAILLEKTQAYLKGLIGEEIKLDPERIDPRERFESFGVDSVTINRFNANLHRDLGALPKTLLYEYETIDDLADYLVREAQQALVAFFNPDNSADAAAAPATRAHDATGTRQVQTELQQVQTVKMHEVSGQTAIAIIGIHGYYPGSRDMNEYWENLSRGRDLVGLVPSSRWDYEEFYHPDPERAAEGKIYCKWGAFLDDFDKFDPLFFNIAPEEARVIDPQERLFLESVWAAIEDAGYTRESLKKHLPKAKSADVGVFVGVTTNSYHLLTGDAGAGRALNPAALPWSIANRVSYFFDFQGPSMPVDTACSSSLVAIHLACESLKRQECQAAVAGGVNLYLHPSKYQSFCQRRMVSLGGKNRSFGAGDDGFVPGEGVGAMLLKRQDKAIEDRDHIYAVIPGSAFDHSGRSNGYTAPNPNSQANLIDHALRRAGIHPETIGYIEGHGTGTQLGDSLEIAALTQTFGKYTPKTQFCPVGSVKANIGHSESAAGIAGVTKVLLQMKHRQLAPTLHSEEINPNIDFRNSPFYLQHKPAPWDTSPRYPRRALVNSFGAGGVNACVILEEYENEKWNPQQQSTSEPCLIVLSARTEDRLREYAGRLLGHLQREESIDLAALSYTLQVGREAMQERLALVVSERQELIARLDEWSRGRLSTGVHRGSPEPREKKSGVRKGDNSLKTLLETRNLDGLATVWVAGEKVDWEALYPHNKPRRISLPTYPFVRERYWISDSPISQKRIAESKHAQLHPLVSHNSSTLKEVSFCSLLSDYEFYALDHRVNGEKIFPGAGFLEMACITGNIAGGRKVCRIRDIVWIRPLNFQKGSQVVQTFLKPIGNGTEYEITSLDEENERIVHSEGRLFFQNGGGRPSADNPVSIRLLKEQCPEPRDGAHYYKVFREHGFDYGPAFQTIQDFYTGDSYALSRLKIPNHLKVDFDQFILHPSIVDGALQTVVGLIGNLEQETLYLPFAVDEVEIIRPIPQTCYAYVEAASSEKQIPAEIRKFNIQLLSESGEVLTRLKNFYVRAFAKIQQGRHEAVDF